MERPLNYTGNRLIEWETVKIFGVRGEERQTIIKDLNKRERRARREAIKRAEQREKREAEEERKRQQEEARKEAERKQKEIARRQRYNEKRKEKRRMEREAKIVRAVVDIRSNKITDEDIFRIEVVENAIKGLEKVVGQSHAYLQVSQNDIIVVSALVRITGKNAASIFWSDFWTYLSKYRDGQIYNVFDTHFDERRNIQNNLVSLDDNDRVRLVVIKADSIPSKAVQQMFRDGPVHCVLQPLYNLWKKMCDNSESEASKKRCGQIARKIKSLEADYPNGVPENKMEEVAKICHRCIVIHDIVGNEIMRFNKNSSKMFHFTNTRVNHLDEGYVTLDKQYESVTQEKMDEIYQEHNDNKEFYLFNGNMKDNIPQSLRSAKGAWAVFHEDHDLFKEFSASQGINNYGIDAVKYNELNAFVKEARLINSAPTPLCDNPNDVDDVNHIDISKAYTQHKYSKYYKGFLGHIQQWRKLPFDTNAVEFLQNHLGIFQFRVLSNQNNLIHKLGLRTGKIYTLPSPEIEYFMNEFGVEVKLIAGAWGSSFDINYTPEMLENRRYCVWAGKLGMDKDCDVYTFKGCKDWASHLKAVLGDENVMYFKDNETIVVKITKKSYFTTHHILAFITSYTRLNMIDIMRKIDGELVKVILDGIYFRGEIPDVDIPHKKNKDVIRHIGFRDAWYFPSEINTNEWPAYNKDLDGPCVLAGPGGTGKSYSVLTDKGIVNPLYVVPSHLLGRKCRATYGCNYTTIHKLIGAESEKNGKKIPCRPYKDQYSEPGVVFIDELTMIEAEWIERAVKTHPNTLFYIAGDIDGKQWFQCRNGHPGAFSKIWMPQNWRYVYYTNDLRSKDEELKAFKQDVRRVMREVFTDGNQMDATRVNYYVKKNYPTVKFDDAVKMFQPGDYWIAGTHKTNKKLLDSGIQSGFINKYKDIVLSTEEINNDCEMRGSFTTHSFQGITIETERVFISLDFFEYAMLYTSISRVRNMNQIVLVN